eukprot:TRINITY_DN167_c0_g1_i2.p3 TRINITY_DN167_c0_g1~~TRINITY_DN167_c0_g1_i2.p3  ORF type:complete len:152 (+),score=60.82 TRINITY_DN167_c0_g1_i2:672-1127(+)
MQRSFRFFSSSFASTVRRTMSSSREVISSADAPKAIGPYSQAIKASGNFLFVSGQLGFDPKTGDFASADVEGQAKQALENMGAILKAGGSSFAQVVKTTILLKDINDFAKVNAVYGEYFPSNPPARATYAVAALPKNGLVEIEAVALTSTQ